LTVGVLYGGMNMDVDDIVVEQPLVATALVAAVATVVYVGLQLAMDGAVAPVETAVFTLIFTLVYVGGNYLLRRNAGDSAGGEGSAGGNSAGGDSVDGGDER